MTSSAQFLKITWKCFKSRVDKPGVYSVSNLFILTTHTPLAVLLQKRAGLKVYPVIKAACGLPCREDSYEKVIWNIWRPICSTIWLYKISGGLKTERMIQRGRGRLSLPVCVRVFLTTCACGKVSSWPANLVHCSHCVHTPISGWIGVFVPAEQGWQHVKSAQHAVSLYSIWVQKNTSSHC